MKKKDVFLTLIAIAALFGVACFVQTEMDSYIRRIVNLCLVYAIIGLSMNLTNGFVGQFFAGAGWFYGYRRLCCRHFYRACRAAA